MVVDACQRLGLRIPGDVAVVGVDNDRVTCEFTSPPLSSIECDWYTIGLEAARRLGQLMAGTPVPATDLLVPPMGVIRRASTDVRVVEHPEVAEAVRYIRDHLSEPFCIKTVLQEVAISRRTLELAFSKSFGCTPYEFVSRERVRKARTMLESEPKAKLAAISQACGFADLRRFRLVFRRQEGVSPAAYRKRLSHTAQLRP